MAPWPVGFTDADFDYHFIWCREDDGRITRRWVPFGMPRLNPSFRRSVCFLYGTHPTYGYGGPWGTGVIVGIEKSKTPYMTHYYAVTCTHNITSGCHDIRINIKGSKSRTIPLKQEDWEPAPNGHDVSAIDITDQISTYSDEVSALPPSILLIQKFMEQVEFDIGEDGFMLGLFSDHSGKHRNLVAARFGNVSLLASADDPVQQGNGNKRPSHIFDMRSRPGFSGSPVFVYRTPDGDLRNTAYGPLIAGFGPQDRWTIGSLPSGEANYSPILRHKDLVQNMFIRLFGIHTAQFHDQVEVTQMETGGKLGSKSLMQSPNSMSVIVPSWEIDTLLRKNPKFIAQRRKREEMEDERNSPKPETGAPERAEKPPESASGANPSHREAFNSLVDAAAKKRPQGG